MGTTGPSLPLAEAMAGWGKRPADDLRSLGQVGEVRISPGTPVRQQASWLSHRPMVSPCMPAQVKHLGQDQEDVPGAYPD